MQETSRRLLDSERAALKYARHIIVTSRTTADTLRELGFAPPPPVTVAEPGTEPAPRAKGGTGRAEIISVGAVVPRKGHDLLIEALAGLTHLDWRCTIIGSLDRDSAFASAPRPADRRSRAGRTHPVHRPARRGGHAGSLCLRRYLRPALPL